VPLRKTRTGLTFSTLCQQPSNRLSDIMLWIICVRKAVCTCI